MPLKRGTSKKAFGSNVRELMRGGKYGQKQAVAIMLSEKRESGKKPEYRGLGDAVRSMKKK